MTERKLKPQHQNFAELIVQGKTASAAYAACYPHCTPLSAGPKGSQLQHKPAVAARIAEIRAGLAEQVKAETVVTLRETLEYLTAVIRTPASLVEKGHRLYQSGRHTPGLWEVKLPCKVRAVELAMKLQGLLPAKVKPAARDTLTDFLVNLRAGGANTSPPRRYGLKPLHQKFAELVVRGQTSQRAYLACFPRSSKSAAKVRGRRLQRKPEVAASIAKFRAEVIEQVKGKLVVTLPEALEFLTEVIRTPAGLVDEAHRLCQRFRKTRDALEVKLPCKLRALELAMKLQGFLSDKVEHEVTDTLQEFLVNLRAGGG